MEWFIMKILPIILTTLIYASVLAQNRRSGIVNVGNFSVSDPVTLRTSRRNSFKLLYRMKKPSEYDVRSVIEELTSQFVAVGIPKLPTEDIEKAMRLALNRLQYLICGKISSKALEDMKLTETSAAQPTDASADKLTQTSAAESATASTAKLTEKSVLQSTGASTGKLTEDAAVQSSDASAKKRKEKVRKKRKRRTIAELENTRINLQKKRMKKDAEQIKQKAEVIAEAKEAAVLWGKLEKRTKLNFRDIGRIEAGELHVNEEGEGMFPEISDVAVQRLLFRRRNDLMKKQVVVGGWVNLKNRGQAFIQRDTKTGSVQIRMLSRLSKQPDSFDLPDGLQFQNHDLDIKWYGRDREEEKRLAKRPLRRYEIHFRQQILKGKKTYEEYEKEYEQEMLEDKARLKKEKEVRKLGKLIAKERNTLLRLSRALDRARKEEKPKPSLHPQTDASESEFDEYKGVYDGWSLDDVIKLSQTPLKEDLFEPQVNTRLDGKPGVSEKPGGSQFRGHMEPELSQVKSKLDVTDLSRDGRTKRCGGIQEIPKKTRTKDELSKELKNKDTSDKPSKDDPP